MTDLPSSRKHNTYIPQGNHIGIDGSSVAQSQVAGQSGRDTIQAARDLFIVNQSEQKNALEFLKERDSELKSQFAEKLERAAQLIAELRQQVEAQLSTISPEGKTIITELLDQLQSITEHETTLERIEKNMSSCLYAAAWLRTNKTNIIGYAVEQTFAHDNAVKPKQSSSHRSLEELRARFGEDIESYIMWIITYLKDGLTPRSFSESVYLDFDRESYRRAFSSVISKLLTLTTDDLKSVSLEVNSFNMLLRYINRFLINEDNGLDLYSQYDL